MPFEQYAQVKLDHVQPIFALRKKHHLCKHHLDYLHIHANSLHLENSWVFRSESSFSSPKLASLASLNSEFFCVFLEKKIAPKSFLRVCWVNGCWNGSPKRWEVGGIVHPPIGRKNATYIPLIVLAEPGGWKMLPTYHLLGEPFQQPLIEGGVLWLRCA